MRRTTLALAALLALLAAGAFWLRGCSDERLPRAARTPADGTPEPSPEPEAVSPRPSRPAEDAPRPAPPAVKRSAPAVTSAEPEPVPKGTLRGRVKILGQPIPRRRLLLPDGTETLTEDVVVDRKGFVKGAFVYVKKGLQEASHTPRPGPILLQAIGYRFEPHVLGVMTGEEVAFENKDLDPHIFHVTSLRNPEWTATLTSIDFRTTRRFTKTDVMVSVRCDFHPWEQAWIGVLDHPFFAVTDGEGRYGFPALPPGRYVVEAWHERYASVSRWVELFGGEDETLDFSLDGKK
jgi:hypothetical protein